ncbi:MAG: hypothetical protein HYY84_07435 [Deltaproteobacteria bacterium]|nr:hypothetical protein [Deltaproteobacteria bacterium]
MMKSWISLTGAAIFFSATASGQESAWNKRKLDKAIEACLGIVRMEKVLAQNPNNSTVFMRFKQLHAGCSAIAKEMPDDPRVQLFAPPMERLAPKIIGTGETKGGDTRVDQIFQTLKANNDAFENAVKEAKERLKGAYEAKPHDEYKAAHKALRGTALLASTILKALPNDADAKKEAERFEQIMKDVDAVSFGEVTAPLYDLYQPKSDACAERRKSLAEKDTAWRAKDPEYDPERIVKLNAALDALDAPADKEKLGWRFKLHRQFNATAKKAKDLAEMSDTCSKYITETLNAEVATKITASYKAYTLKACKALGKSHTKVCAREIHVVLSETGSDDALEKLEREIFETIGENTIAEAKESGKLKAPGCYFFKGKASDSGSGLTTVFDGGSVKLRCFFSGEQETGGWSAAGIKVVGLRAGGKSGHSGIALKPAKLNGKSQVDHDVTKAIAKVVEDGRNKITLSVFYQWIEHFWEEKWDESRQAVVKRKMQKTEQRMLSFGEFLYYK